MTKADQVRAMIAVAKGEGKTVEDLVGQVAEQFGFTRGLARAYISNNWNKVEAKVIEKPAPAKKAKAEKKPAEAKGEKTLSMTPSAIRKREARAAAKKAKEQPEQQPEGELQAA